jgi:hypothetical protein
VFNLTHNNVYLIEATQDHHRILMYKIIKKNDMKNPLEIACLKLAKELIEIKYLVEIIFIEIEDGSGRNYIIVTKDNPLKKRFIKL